MGDGEVPSLLGQPLGQSSSRLSGLFSKDSEANSAGNHSLSYKAPKEPKRTAQLSAAAPPAQKPAEPAVAKVVASFTVQLYRLEESRQYTTIGAVGCVFLRTPTNPVMYQVLMYLANNQHVCMVKVDQEFIVTLQPNNYCSIVDNSGVTWSLLFRSEEERSEFAIQALLARSSALSRSQAAMIRQDVVLGVEKPLLPGDQVGIVYSLWNESPGEVGVRGQIVEKDGSKKFRIGDGKCSVRGAEEVTVGMARKGRRIYAIVDPTQANITTYVLVEVDKVKVKKRGEQEERELMQQLHLQQPQVATASSTSDSQEADGRATRSESASTARVRFEDEEPPTSEEVPTNRSSVSDSVDHGLGKAIVPVEESEVPQTPTDPALADKEPDNAMFTGMDGLEEEKARLKARMAKLAGVGRGAPGGPPTPTAAIPTGLDSVPPSQPTATPDAAAAPMMQVATDPAPAEPKQPAPVPEPVPTQAQQEPNRPEPVPVQPPVQPAAVATPVAASPAQAVPAQVAPASPTPLHQQSSEPAFMRVIPDQPEMPSAHHMQMHQLRSDAPSPALSGVYGQGGMRSEPMAPMQGYPGWGGMAGMGSMQYPGHMGGGPSDSQSMFLLMETRQGQREAHTMLMGIQSKIDDVSTQIRSMDSNAVGRRPFASPAGEASGEAVLSGVQNLLSEMTKLKDEVEEKSSRIDSMRATISELQAQNDRLIDENSKNLQQRSGHIQEKTEENRQRIINLQEEKAQVEFDLCDAQQKISSLSRQLSTAQRLQEDLQEEVAELKKVEENLRSRIKANAENEKKIVEYDESELENVKSSLEAKKTELAEYQAQAESSAKELESERESHEKKLNDLLLEHEQEKSSLREELEALKAHLEDARKTASDAISPETMEALRLELQQENRTQTKEHEEKYAEMERSRDELQTQFNEVAAKLEESKQQNKKLAETAAAARNQAAHAPSEDHLKTVRELKKERMATEATLRACVYRDHVSDIVKSTMNDVYTGFDTKLEEDSLYKGVDTKKALKKIIKNATKGSLASLDNLPPPVTMHRPSITSSVEEESEQADTPPHTTEEIKVETEPQVIAEATGGTVGESAGKESGTPVEDTAAGAENSEKEAEASVHNIGAENPEEEARLPADGDEKVVEPGDGDAGDDDDDGEEAGASEEGTGEGDVANTDEGATSGEAKKKRKKKKKSK